ncbi:hypothetical protein [Microbacterium arborescens]
MMGYKTHRQMSLATLGVGLPTLERAALLDMALAVEDGSLTYGWGHERLAVALDKEPGTKAAKRALERVLSSLIDKGLIVRTSRAHRGHNAEYRLAVLEGNGPRSERGPIVAPPVENGPRFEAEWAPVSDRKGPTLGGAPLPITTPNTDAHNSASARWRMTDAQRRNVVDALSAIAHRSHYIDVMAFRDRELAYLDSLTFEERDDRIGTWAGLRSRAMNDGDEDLVEDERLHDLLEAHGFVYVSSERAWPTRIPGQPEAWTDHREESA